MILPTITGPDSGAAEPAPPGRRLRILIVDDEAPIREVLSELLSFDGHEVEAAEDGPRALEKFGRAPADVVLTDFSMPGMDGGKLALEIKRLAPTVPVILVTGVKPRVIDRRSIEEVIEKPFTHRVISEAIHRSLARRTS
jgi:two-component system, cell cycle sensor histidine kinase and response regulator CckA